MSKQANITNIESLDAFRADVREFQQIALKELMSMQRDVQKMEAWITLEQPPTWKMRSRKIEAEVNNARSDLERAKISRPDQSPRMFADQRKALQKAKAKQEFAMDRIRSLKRWASLIQRESMMLQGGLQSLGNAVEGDLTKLITMLKVLADHLDAYLKTPPPPNGFNQWAAEMQGEDHSFAREGDEAIDDRQDETNEDAK